MFSQITSMLRTCDTEHGVLPPAEVYNEGWMLRLILDWFSRQSASNHQLSFEKGARWYSEILLPSQFRPRFQTDPQAESYTHADGVIGHFTVDRAEKGDIDLFANATQFVVIEAKIFSKLSRGIKNFKSYDQAARTVACMAETLSIGKRLINDISRLGFYVIAPERQLKFEPTFQTFLQKDSIRIKVRKRIKAFPDPADAETKNRWLETWFLPALESIDIQCLTWEEIIAYIYSNDRRTGDALSEFYEKCLVLNQPRSTFSPTEKRPAPLPVPGRLRRLRAGLPERRGLPGGRTGAAGPDGRRVRRVARRQPRSGDRRDPAGRRRRRWADDPRCRRGDWARRVRVGGGRAGEQPRVARPARSEEDDDERSLIRSRRHDGRELLFSSPPRLPMLRAGAGAARAAASGASKAILPSVTTSFSTTIVAIGCGASIAPAARSSSISWSRRLTEMAKPLAV